MNSTIHPLSTLNNTELVGKLAAGDKTVFNYIVESYYVSLCRGAVKLVRYSEPAEEIVQDVFVSLWQKRHVLNIRVSLQAYLHTAVRYQSINYLRSKYAKPGAHAELIEEIHPIATTTDDQLAAKELETLMAKAIQQLPDQCRIIFDLSRNGGLTYKEIAENLNISQKTVETQMTIALSRLRAHLNKYWDKMIVLPFLITLL